MGRRISDHKDRVKDGSISYEYFNVEPDRISYKINRCMYKEIFDYYGIGGAAQPGLLTAAQMSSSSFKLRLPCDFPCS